MTNIYTLKGDAYKKAIEEARTELSEAFGYNLKRASRSLIAEMCDDHYFFFTADGSLK